MYIYNVTMNIAEEIHDEWLKWIKEKHIPEMLNLGIFTKAKMSEVLVEEEMGGTTYSVQYTTASLELLDQYYNLHADEMRNEGAMLFKDKMLSFRTELKVISEQFSQSSKN